MIHQRSVIREAIVAALAAAGTSAGTRVYDTPYDPRDAFPALCVQDDAEEQAATTFGGGQASRTIERSLRIIVTAELQQVANYARARDSLLADVEARLATLSIAGVKSITPAGYVADLGVSGERPIAVGHQRFDVVYATLQATPATAI